MQPTVLPTAGTSFVASRNGFGFTNASLLGRPLRVLGLRVGVVVGGLCGGMCVSARDRWRRGEPPPAPGECPDPLLHSIQLAQLRSFRASWAPARYLRLQQPAATAERVAATLGDAVPALRRDLAAGEPVLLALVCALGRSPALLSRHHVVLATCSAPDGPDAVLVGVYDPNHPDTDEVTLRITEDGTVHHSRGRTVHALFSLDRTR